VSAEDVVRAFPAELVVAQLVLPCHQSKRGRFDDRIPVPHFCADGTVALVRTGAQINIGLKADGSAVATSRVRFRHYSSPNGPWVQIISLMATLTE
jgi:hypothetical protein